MHRLLLAASLAVALVCFFAVVSVQGDSLPQVDFDTDARSLVEDVGQVALTATLDADPALTVTVRYSTTDGTAVGGQDFLASTGSLTFTPGITLQVAAVAVLDDTVPESDESFFVVLTDSVNASLSAYPMLTITIADDGDAYLTYLPLVIRRWPPVPYDPVLDPIANPEGDGWYVVTWSEQPTQLATNYVVEEAKDAAFTTDLLQACSTNTQNCTVNGRVAGTYFYRVKGQNVWGESGWSNVQNAVVLVPETPTLHGIDNQDGDGAYNVVWDAAARATGYRVHEDDNPDFTSPTLVHTGEPPYYLVTGRAEGTYYYRVQAYGPTGESGWSAVQGITVLPAGTPILYEIENADGDGSYTVDWSDAPRVTGYILQVDASPDFPAPTQVYAGAASQWSVSGLPAGVAYFRVMATGPTGSSEWSNTQSVTVLPPGTPVLYTIDNHDFDGNYTVTWSSAPRTTSFRLEEDEDPSFGSPTIRYEGAELAWSAAGQPYGAYHYRVMAIGPTGHGGWSNQQTVRVPSPPLPLGEKVRFRGAWEDVPLEGQVAFSEYRTVLVDDYHGPVYPGGIFVVVLLDVTNHGLVSDDVGYYGSFKVRDSVGRQFDIGELEVLWAAEDEYGYESVYEAIQPGFTRRLVFAFDVLPASEDLHLISLSPW